MGEDTVLKEQSAAAISSLINIHGYSRIGFGRMKKGFVDNDYLPEALEGDSNELYELDHRKEKSVATALKEVLDSSELAKSNASQLTTEEAERGVNAALELLNHVANRSDQKGEPVIISESKDGRPPPTAWEEVSKSWNDFWTE